MTFAGVQLRYRESGQRAALGGNTELVKALTEICSGRVPAASRVCDPGFMFSLSVLEDMTTAGGNLMQAELESRCISHVDSLQPLINRLVIDADPEPKLRHIVSQW